jgi:glycosyltransferase involved in cell wall biosynthesis
MVGREVSMKIAISTRASIYAAPALCEPFGLGILEAARERCALVLADVSSLREPWEDAAIFVDPRDPTALQEVLACLIDAPALREDLGERARKRAEEHSVGRSAHSRLCQRLLMSVPV